MSWADALVICTGMLCGTALIVVTAALVVYRRSGPDGPR